MLCVFYYAVGHQHYRRHGVETNNSISYLGRAIFIFFVLVINKQVTKHINARIRI